MNTRWARWLMMSFLVLQFVAVAADAHQFSPFHGEAPARVVETEKGTGVGADTKVTKDVIGTVGIGGIVGSIGKSADSSATGPLVAQESSEQHSSSHDHCPHCCHCHCHAVATIPALTSQRHSALVPPYHITFHSRHSSAFFRPPRLA